MGPSTSLSSVARRCPPTASDRTPPTISELRELERYSRRDLRQTFPARIRRYRQYDSKEQGTLLNERVITDFYWGDIAAIGQGVFGLLVALLKTILGLCHAIRENAHDVFPDPKGYDRVMRCIASGAALVIHGPIAAINAVLLVGVFVAPGLSPLVDDASTRVWLAGPLISVIAIVVAGWLAWRVSYAYLMRLFTLWVVITGLVLLGFSLVGQLHQLSLISDPFAGFDSWLKNESCTFAAQTGPDVCVAGYQGIYL